MSEGGKEKQEIENLFEKIMKEVVPNLLKETDMQVKELQKVPNKMTVKRPNARHSIIKMPKGKDRILKAATEKQLVTYRRIPIRLSAASQKKPYRQEKAGKKNSKS